MKKISLFLALFFLAGNAEAKIVIVACEPEWQSLASEIVSGKAQVLSATNGRENPLKIRARNSIASVMRNADMLFCSGAGLEDRWLEATIKKSANARLDDPQRILYAANYAMKKPLDKEAERKKSEKETGEKKPYEALPRVHLNPHNILLIAAEFTNRVKAIDPKNAEYYQKSFEKFSVKWGNAIIMWEKAAKSLKGVKVVTQDDSWGELVSWLQLDLVAQINADKSYVSQSKKIMEVTQKLKESPADAIIFASYEDKRVILTLSDRTHIPAILLPFTVKGAANSSNLFDLFTTTINSLLANCGNKPCPQISRAGAVKIDSRHN